MSRRPQRGKVLQEGVKDFLHLKKPAKKSETTKESSDKLDLFKI